MSIKAIRKNQSKIAKIKKQSRNYCIIQEYLKDPHELIQKAKTLKRKFYIAGS
jgi:glutathione synthase/RimK-type ligase-like ATP-grasp enzyme